MTEKPQDIETDSRSQADQDRVDLNAEMAGVDNGRVKRFFTDNSLAFSNKGSEPFISTFRI